MVGHSNCRALLRLDRTSVRCSRELFFGRREFRPTSCNRPQGPERFRQRRGWPCGAASPRSARGSGVRAPSPALADRFACLARQAGARLRQTSRGAGKYCCRSTRRHPETERSAPPWFPQRGQGKTPPQLGGRAIVCLTRIVWHRGRYRAPPLDDQGYLSERPQSPSALRAQMCMRRTR